MEEAGSSKAILVKQYWKIFLVLGFFSLTDSITTTYADLNFSVTELSPVGEMVLNNFAFLEANILLSLSIIPVSLFYLHLWARPSTNNVGFHTIIALTSMKILATISNTLNILHLEKIIALPPETITPRTIIIYTPILLVIRGGYIDWQNTKRKKQLEHLPSPV